MDILTPEQIDYLSSALDSRLNEQAKNLILYYDLCQYDDLVYDFMTHLAFKNKEELVTKAKEFEGKIEREIKPAWPMAWQLRGQK